MDLGIQNKKALVFASSEGLGKAVARALIEEGVKVFLSSRNEEKFFVAVAGLLVFVAVAGLLVCSCSWATRFFVAVAGLLVFLKDPNQLSRRATESSFFI